MRFEDSMRRSMALTEDWGGNSHENREKRFRRDMERGFGPRTRGVHQREFEMERQKGIGGDVGDISQYRNDPTEREYRETNLGELSKAKAELKRVYDERLYPAKDVLFNYYSVLKDMFGHFGHDMSGVGRSTGVDLRRLVPAVKDAYDAIAKLGRLI